jgi:hypothetical protein
METEGTLPSSQDTVNRTYPQPHEYSHTTPSYLSCSISILSSHHCLDLPNALYFWFPQQNPIYIPISANSCYMPSRTNPPPLDHSNCIWRRVQVLKFLIMSCSPATHYFIPFSPNIFLRIPVIRNRDSSVGTAIGYGLDDQGGRSSSPGRVNIFHFSISSRSALGSTQPPIKSVPGALSRG